MGRFRLGGAVDRGPEQEGETLTQRERIERYEQMLDRAERAVRQAEAARKACEGVRGDLAELERYYTGPEWKADYEADEAGLLPADLKRGVLSQDGIDSLLERARQIGGGHGTAASDKIIRYDEGFLRNLEELKAQIESGDRPKLYRFLLDHFGYIFRINQYYWIPVAEGSARDFEAADEETKRELMRPLSHRQYRMVERSFSRWKEEEEFVIWSIWDFLNDNDRIYQKKTMSSAEVSGCSMILENVYSCLAKG